MKKLVILLPFIVGGAFAVMAFLDRVDRHYPAHTEKGGIFRASILDVENGLFHATRENHLTIVELASSTCGRCRDFEQKSVLPLVAVRPDIVVQKVMLDEICNGVTSDPTTTKRCNEISSKIDEMDVCGTPHVEVFAPDGKPVARDTCHNKAGQRYVKRLAKLEVSKAK